MVKTTINFVTIFNLITIKLIFFNLIVFNNELVYNHRISLYASASDNNFQLIDVKTIKNCEKLKCEFKCKESIEGGECICDKGQQLAADKVSCIEQQECSKWGTCDQLCTTLTASTYKCSCVDGYTLQPPRTCKIANNTQPPHLLFAHFKSIFKLDAQMNLQILSNTTSASGLDFHYEKQLIFWTDTETKKIYSIPFKNSNSVFNSTNLANYTNIVPLNEISMPHLWNPISLAVDWINDKLYVADGHNQKIDVMDLDGSHHSILISQNLTQPQDIVLDPRFAYLFFTDVDKIDRASMDGSQRKTVVSSFIYKATGLTLDLINQRLIWCDSQLDQIVAVNYDGSNRHVILKGSSKVPAPVRLATIENKIYWTDSTRQGILKIDMYNESSQPEPIYRDRKISKDPRSIKIYHQVKQPKTTNPCKVNNGGCEHLCILTRVGPEDDLVNFNLAYRCACKIGYELTENRRTCTQIKKFLLYSQQKFVRGVLINQEKSFNDAMVPIVSRSARFVGLDYSAKDEYIYYSDVILDVIYKIKIDGTGKDNVLASQNEGVEGLALDWVTNNLYYIDSRKGTLNVINVNNRSYRRTLLKNLKRPRAIVVHPNKAQIFYSEWDRPANISRTTLDGQNLIIFKNVLLGWPNGLTLDMQRDKLYWCDALLDHIQYSNLDGSDIHTITSPRIKHPFSLVIDLDTLYVTDWRIDSILSMNKINGSNEKIIRSIEEGNRLYGIKIFSKSSQYIDPANPCLNNNGNCQKFCFSIPFNNTIMINGTLQPTSLYQTEEEKKQPIKYFPKCGCPYGETLASDNRTCVVNNDAEPPIKACSNAWDFTCANQRCIPQGWACDNENDCLDGSDEPPTCKTATCGNREFSCGNGRCIPSSFVCDSDNDCGDNSDEDLATCKNRTCTSSEFTCLNGRCLSTSWKCDGENDCGDNSDEAPELCASEAQKTCSYFQFTCPESGVCIPKTWLCDSDNDCGDNSDEKDCPEVKCTKEQFKCDNGKQCIHSGYRCDGLQDCTDGSDEKDCPNKQNNQCTDKQFKCGSGECISASWYCDSNKDCLDGSDEPSTCNRKQCPQNNFRCKNGKCIFSSWICDGTDDCGDNSDEDSTVHACEKLIPSCELNNQWSCPNVTGVCINLDKVCDGKFDCPNKLDESPECDLADCKTMNCNHQCQKTPLGPICTCPKGERIDKRNKKECVDIDECAESAPCSQICINTKSSFKCQCEPGYTLEKHTHCKANDRNLAYLIISNRKSILISNLNTTSLERIPIKVENVVATASEMSTGTIYWSDMHSKKILRLKKGSTTPEVVISSGLDLIEGLAIDWIGKNLYWLDSKLKSVEVTTLDGKNHVVLISSNISQPRGIALDPRPGARVAFISDWGENPRIERFGLDGSERTTIISTKIYWPNGLTLNLPDKKLYFADSKLDYIDYCDYDGKNRKQVLSHNHYLLHPHSLTIFEDTLYWTDRQLNRVLSCHKQNGSNQTVVSHLVSQPLGIHINHPVLQPQAPNPCEKANCSHICLLSPNKNGYTCKCPPGYSQQTDNQCVQVETPYLMIMKGSQLVDLSLTTTSNIRNNGFFTPLIGINNGYEFDFDKEKEVVYYLENSDNDAPTNNGTVYKANLSNGNVTKFFNDELIGNPSCIAFDWIGRNLYVGNIKASNLMIAKAEFEDKKYSRVILANDGTEVGVSKPKSIVLDPIYGNLYWLDDGGVGVPKKIGKALMDGSNPSILVKDNLNTLEAITIDIVNKKIYFSQSSIGAIESIDTDGQNRRTIITASSNIAKVSGLAVYTNRLYYLDSIYENIVRVNLPDGTNPIKLEENVANLKSLKVYSKRMSIDNHPCRKSNGNCNHLCVPLPKNSKRCLCSTGFKADGDQKCDKYQSFAVVSSLSKMQGFSLDDHGEAMLPVAGPNHNILHIDVHVARSAIYYVDYNPQQLVGGYNGIYRVKPDGSEKKQIISDGIGSNGIRGISIDYIGGNLYFTNVFPHETYIEVCSLNGNNRMVLWKTTTDAPREIAVDPVKRYLFWIDYGQFPKIIRAYLDASNRVPIVSSGISYPRDLTIDIKNGDVYWVDVKEDTIQKIGWNGQKRQTILSNLPTPYGIALLEDTMYWVDRNLRTIFKSSKFAETNSSKTKTFESFKSNIDTLRDIVIFDKANQPVVSSPCSKSSDNSNQCEQLCFAMPDEAVGTPNFKCACSSGVLAKNGKSCSDVSEYLIFTTRKEIRSVHLDPNAAGTPFLAKTNMTNVVGADFDYNQKRIFFTQIRPDSSISYFDIEHPDVAPKTILKNNINPEGVAYDWTSKKVYWTDSANRSIYAMNLDGSSLVMIVRVERPRAIVLHPCEGKLFFTDWGRLGNSGKILRTTMAGNSKKVIIENDIIQPSGLAIDYDENKLYWTDALREKIERSDMDGMNRETLISATIYPFAITVFGDYIYWTDLQLRGVYRAEKHTGAGVTEMVKRLEESPRDIHVFSSARQTCSENPCLRNNGGCAHSCHQAPNGTVECKCNNGFKLANEGRMCVLSNITCESNKFTCATVQKCLPSQWACDGTDDCGDGSDESQTFCDLHTCGPNEFRCGNGRCIFQSWLCDHSAECIDGSDEENCKYLPCAEGEFTCTNYKCIPNAQVCDHRNDCGDSSDENNTICNARNITTSCPNGHLKCRNTNICVDPYFLCDGDNDCGDNSDEDLITCKNRTCPHGSFRCSDSHRCIPGTWVCDGEQDCKNGEDEPPNCKQSGTCFGDLFTCDNGNCIPSLYICDSDNDCLDGSDEDARHQCDTRKCDEDREFTCTANKAWGRAQCIPKRFICDFEPDCVDGADEDVKLGCAPPEACESGQFRCKNNRCIPANFVCDSDNDCGDASDEPKNCTFRPCAANEFSCANSKCVRLTYLCDQDDDCGDGSDESPAQCKKEEPTCPQFKCKNGQCINYELVCNKNVECSDGSDEPPTCGIDECAKPELNQCEHKCVNTLTSYHCECNPGYKLMPDGKACVDIDECVEEKSKCSQYCFNTPGSFYCKCNETYFDRELDGKTCKRRDAITPWLIFSNRYYLRNMSLDGHNYNLIKMELKNVVALDFDYKEDRIYYSDVGNKTINRIFVNGTGEQTIIKHEAHGLEGLAVCWISRKIYWLDRTSKQLLVAELNGSNRKTLLSGQMTDPRAIAVHPGRGYLFFTDWGHHAFIARIGMDGSNFKRIIMYEEKLIWPNAITIDYFSDKLFFADAHLDYIEYSDFDGKHRHQVLSGQKAPHVFALSVFQDMLYWTDWNLKALFRAHKFTGENIEVLRNTSHRPYDVHVFHPLKQPQYNNPCAEHNGGCSHLCLLNPNGTNTCACPNNFVLQTDGLSCIANCTKMQHRCGAPDDKCIPAYWKCDNEKDCVDGSDELNCPPFNCRPGMFQCHTTTKSNTPRAASTNDHPTNPLFINIRRQSMSNSLSSPFSNLGPLVSLVSSLSSVLTSGGNSTCISRIRICDGNSDCADGSDESFCSGDCGEHSFKCKSTGRCLPASWKCDNENDCADGSDEAPEVCHNKTCDAETQFQCANGKCIPKLWYCDQDEDCGDGSDEPAFRCRNRNCTTGWRKCPGRNKYRCIPSWNFCNMVDDCGDNSDESDPSLCPKCHETGDFKCKNGRCISLRWKCDFSDDCGDNSDEEPEMCKDHYRECSESEFQCNNKRCIKSNYRCDLEDDCDDGSDELNCLNYTCKPDQFKCKSGHCISTKLLCDSHRDCLDASDELNCPPRYEGGKYCPPNRFQCNNTVCVGMDELCNNSDDCGDLSDEDEKLCSDFKCDTTRKFQCKNRKCINYWKVCNGIDECGDGSDENDHTLCKKWPSTCLPFQFKCANDKCIQHTQVCDHRNDCGDYSDEIGCHQGVCTKEDKGGCQHACINMTDLHKLSLTPTITQTNLTSGYLCTCPKGYQVDKNNTKRCVDIDECAKFGSHCSQICENLEGSFECKCRPGFRLYDERCVAEGDAPFLMFANGPDIRAIDYDQERQDLIVTGQSRIQSIDYDPINQIVYWTDTYEQNIKRAYIPDLKDLKHGSEYAQSLDIKYISKPTDIAVDWVAGNLYWCDNDVSVSTTKTRGQILVSLLDGRYKRSLVSSNLERPTSIALSPENGLILWTDAGVMPKIEKAWMDGTKRKVLVNEKLGFPSGIVVDTYQKNRIYWADSKQNVIESITIDGLDRTVVIQGEIYHPFSLEIFEDQLFWVTRDTGEIYRQDKNGRGVKVRMRRSYATDVKVYQQLRYNTSIENPCANAECSHLCLLIPGGYRCQCPDSTKEKYTTTKNCPDSSFEPAKPKPIHCKCQNGGACTINPQTNQINCVCPISFEGNSCDEYVARRHIGYTSNSLVTSIMLPILLLLIATILASGLFMYFKKRNYKSNYNGGSVLFRTGANIEFSANGFLDNGEPIDNGFNLGDLKATEFNNPMYETIKTNETSTTDDLKTDSTVFETSVDKQQDKKSAIGSMVSSLSSMMIKVKSNTKDNRDPTRQNSLNPSSVDTGKDTQNLVEEDKSEC